MPRRTISLFPLIVGLAACGEVASPDDASLQVASLRLQEAGIAWVSVEHRSGGWDALLLDEEQVVVGDLDVDTAAVGTLSAALQFDGHALRMDRDPQLLSLWLDANQVASAPTNDLDLETLIPPSQHGSFEVLLAAMDEIGAPRADSAGFGADHAAFDVEAEPNPDLAAASLWTNRDRLLGTLPGGRCHAWNQMDEAQRGVFLTITDLLGKRSFVSNPVRTYEKVFGDWCGGPETGNSFYMPDEWDEHCDWVSGWECYDRGACEFIEQPRTGRALETALDHVNRLYGVVGNDCPWYNQACTCGGGDRHRLFFQADGQLMGAIANFEWGMPAWGRSNDPAGAHGPFTNTSETMQGATPSSATAGQMHFWAWPWQAQAVHRPGANGVRDSNMVEIDIDYNFWHDSNPQCWYGSRRGRDKYAQEWSTNGMGGNPEYHYRPSGC